ncbi:MAG: alpha/beta hydrolase [Patescibacteria group bacterium]|nr:alpha/beta hydrolase [Patescibacteria group bacterium]
MEEKVISINNLKVNYKATGSGPVILILHGWPSSSDSWARSMKSLSIAGYQVICPDLPGFGKSDTQVQPWSVANYMEWVLKFADSLKLDDFILLGHSFGGRVAVKFSAKYGDRLKCLILCDSAGIRPKLDAKSTAISKVVQIGNNVFSPGFLVEVKNVLRNILYFFIKNRDYVKAKGVMKATMTKVVEEDLGLYLPKIKNKTLLIWGKKDTLVPIEYAYQFKDKIRDSKLEIIPGVGHSPHFRAFERLTEIIIMFLNAL